MSIFTDNQYESIKDLIWKIESNNKYGYYSTSPEGVISIGAAGWQSPQANDLLRQIKNSSSLFNRVDINNSALTIKMLTSPSGKIIQNRVFRQQVNEYASRIFSQLDVTDIPALAFCVFIYHHCGYQVINRFINSTPRPYNLDNIYKSCYFDDTVIPKDLAKTVYVSIKEHFKEELQQQENNLLKGGISMISTCGHDEKGGYTGGVAGDQTGKEWYLFNWYDGKWNYIMRHPNHQVREMIADFAEKAAKNDHIGYDQGQRTTFWYHLKASNYDPSKITVDCECDCSAGVSAIVKAVGTLLNDQEMAAYSESNWTGSMLVNLKACGFQALSNKKYINDDSCLARGDILLNVQTHACINLTDGPSCDDPTGTPNTTSNTNATANQTQAAKEEAAKQESSSSSNSGGGSKISYEVEWTGYTKKNVIPRTWAGNEYSALKSISNIPKGTAVGVCCTIKNNKTNWYFVKINGQVWGFIPANSVSKEPVNKTSKTSTVTAKAPSTKPVAVGKITAALIDVKSWAGAEYSNIIAWPQLAKGNLVDLCDTVKDCRGKPWYYVRIAGRYYGFVNASYIKRM